MARAARFARTFRFARSFRWGVALLFLAGPAAAHFERAVTSPIRPGPVPDLARACVDPLVVCKPDSIPTKAERKAIKRRIAQAATDEEKDAARAELDAWKRNQKLFGECRYEHIQDAVDDAGDGACILVLPGVYLEEPSRARPTSSRGDNPNGSYSYDWHLASPNDANLVGIIGKKNVTLEGTGATPRDVVVDAGFSKDVVIRGDRSDGIIVRNLWAKDANEHAIYMIEVDGYVFDRTLGSFAGDYELFSTACDNGLFTDCEATGGSDSGLYIGQSPDTREAGRWSAEVRRCKMHHNSLGFSGTQGNSVWMHDNEFTDNAVGISYDTENDHVNAPQRASLVEDNWIHHNNFDVYATDSDVPPGGPGYDFFRYPVGTGLWIIGGEDNVVRENRVHDNQRFGFIVAANPLEGPVLAAVHGNQVLDNLFGADAGPGAGPNSTALPPGGDYAPGGSDWYWDETGNDNCFGPGAGKVDPEEPPGPCPFPNEGYPGVFAPPNKLGLLVSCQITDPPTGATFDQPYRCPWGGPNDADRRNGAERECGDGVVGLGEECDPAAALAESCSSLGQGDGTLACGPFCTFDTSACQAESCGRVGPGHVRFKRLPAPFGNEGASLELDALDDGGRSFDPTTEGLELVLRGEDGFVFSGVLPAGSPGWSSLAGGGFAYEDPTGARAGFREVVVGAGASFAVGAELEFVNLVGLDGSQTLDAVLRIGDDCWSAAFGCKKGRCARTVELP
ncbi:MAG TPA: right-handed parallel beta-helix repeat-containing protein [Myxococcota bacterium]|nr:right-handed parallel beta-helix repeat-containing protein [Myxococcota bacterium]